MKKMMKDWLRVPRPIYSFIAVMCVFMLTQISLDHMIVFVKTSTNSIGKSIKFNQFFNNSSFLTQQQLLDNSTVTSLQISKSDEFNNGRLDEQVFVRSAFRVSDTEIRLTVLRDHRSSRAIFYEFGSKIGQLTLTCNLPKCLEMYSPKCKVIGFIGQIFDLDENNTGEIVRLRLDQSELAVEVPIIDVRPKNDSKYEHVLGVCVQPIYMHTGYIVFIQFFEHWLAKNATKFYIYRHSYSKEVQQILDFYVKNSNVSIEFIDWSDLPSIRKDYQPAKFVFRLEVMISIFDCLHRARNNVKYIAQTDLDELLIVKDGNLIKTLDYLSAKNPDMASVSMVSRRAKLPPSFEDISLPSELNFDLLSEISVESYLFPRPAYSKLIYRPERIFRAHIHYQIGAERFTSSNGNQTYKQINISHGNIYILHLRRVIDNIFKLRRFIKSNILKQDTAKWQLNFQNRIQNQNFSISDWKNTGLEVLNQVETCRRKHAKRRLKECHAIFDCTRGLNTSDWVWAKNQWVLLY